MEAKHILASAAAALAFSLASPAIAQQTNDDNQINNGSGNTQNEDSLQNVGNNTLNNWNNFFNDNAADTSTTTVTKTYTSTVEGTYTDSGQDNDHNNSGNDNTGTTISADQTLLAVNANLHLDEVVDLDGEDETDTAVGYNSGNNTVNGSAFAAYAGILNAAWNTGINANTQAATNIGAQGTVTFGE